MASARRGLGRGRCTADGRARRAKGEYSGWRATRATGDFDLRTFDIRAYPVEHVEGLRPGMSAYAQAPLWPVVGGAFSLVRQGDPLVRAASGRP